MESANIKSRVDAYLKAGEILNPEYESLKYDINRIIYAEGKHIFNTHVAGTGGDLEIVDPAFQDLQYSTPGNMTELMFVKNKLAKVKTPEGKAHPLYKDMDAMYNKWSDVAAKMKDLKTKIVKVSQRRLEVKSAAEAAKRSRFSDASSLTKVLLEHKSEFIKKSREAAHTFYSRSYETLKKHNNDIDSVAPRPDTRMSRDAYQSSKNRREFYQMLLRKTISQLMDEAAEAAEQDFMAWVHKMIEKIGKSVVKADMTGNPWNGSNLHVVCIDGEEQTWRTQMIINQSKYQRLFNQFPSRRIR